MFVKKTYKLGAYREVIEFHNGRYGAPGQQRQKKTKLTSEQRRKKNARQKMITCRRKLRMYFTAADYFTTLTYRKEDRPADMAAAKEDFRRFLRQIRREYKRAEKELRWICNIENGSRGAWHVHIVLNRIPDLDRVIAKAWQHGRIQIQLLYEDGAFDRLAAYITKSPDTEPRLSESHYSSSRNLPIPEPEITIYKHQKTWGRLRIPKGWRIESMTESVNPYTGYLHRLTTLRRIE